MRVRDWRVAWVVGVVALGLLATSAAHGAPPVVRAIFFYMPICEHCHAVIENTLPPIAERFGDQLEIAFVDIDTAGGNDLFYATVDAFAIPEAEQGVPLMVVGSDALNGDLEIPERLEAVVEAGLAAGGVDWPDIPGVEGIVSQLEAPGSDAPTTPLTQGGAQRAGADAAPSDAGTNTTVSRAPDLTRPSMRERWAADPIAFGITVVVLVLMVASVARIAYAWLRDGLAAGSPHGWQAWVIPALCVLGIGVAGYLGYVESTSSKAVCGPVGDCNAVQQSEFARLFGVLPIGVFGLLGYVFIVAVWAWQRRGPADLARRTRWVLPAVLLFGVAFSTYLTLLELFVIGAICMWCVTSAVTMTALLWAVHLGWGERVTAS